MDHSIVEHHVPSGEGHLSELNDWSEDIARQYAKKDGLELTREHMEILQYLRKYYDKKQPYN